MDINLVKNQYSLSIRILSDGFSLSVYDENYQLISAKHITPVHGADKAESLQEILVSHKELHLAYKDIVIICESEYHTIVPEIFYKAENEKEFLRLQHPSLPDSYQLFHSKLPLRQCTMIYGLEQNVIKVFQSHFQQVNPESHLVSIAKKIISEDKNKLTLWVRQEETDCIVYNDHRIVLFNKYAYEQPEDILYHVLNIYQQLNLNPSDFCTELYDNENSNNIALFKKHLPGVIIKSKKTAHEDYQWKI